MKALSLVMAGLFAFAAAVQWNDPDPLRWIALYGTAMLLALAAARGRASARVCWAAAAVFGVASALQLPALAGMRGEAFTSWQMHGGADEETRELFGTLICLAWALVLAVWRGRAGAAGARR